MTDHLGPTADEHTDPTEGDRTDHDPAGRRRRMFLTGAGIAGGAGVPLMPIRPRVTLGV